MRHVKKTLSLIFKSTNHSRTKPNLPIKAGGAIAPTTFFRLENFFLGKIYILHAQIYVSFLFTTKKQVKIKKDLHIKSLRCLEISVECCKNPD